ncbi:deaminase [Enemella evansiae]|uniref:dihydrofolate reductase family protein n=1 Tax=Enemella evansiae TaxID=2016499 RepID=UPI000B9631CD|nr:dihydrofolate reductase family protein [Enemella evansiae]OYO02124.1 deaminase [Enemella evansiae]
MTRYRYYTATTLDGYLADPDDSLDWLLSQPETPATEHPDQPGGIPAYEDLIAEIGVLVMGAATYQWVLDHLAASGEDWPYSQPCFVFTHRDLTPATDTVRLVAGEPGDFRTELERIAGGKDVWVVGGGELATRFATAGMLDELLLSIAPVTLGAGKPLFPVPFDLELVSSGRSGTFLTATYRPVGPRSAGAA